jgi:hypothetical protein
LLITSQVCFGQGQRGVPFKVGERFRYNVNFNFIEAGGAVLELKSEEILDNYPVYYSTLEIWSNGLLDKFYSVRDKYESWIDKESLFSRKFKKDIKEGKYKKNYVVQFDYEDSLAYSSSNTIEIFEPIHDVLSVFYHIRAESLWVGKKLRLNNFDNDKFKPYNSIIREIREVSTSLGNFECFVIEPYTEEGDLFKYKGRPKIYLSNDCYKIPVKIESKATIGSIIMELKSIEGKNN